MSDSESGSENDMIEVAVDEKPKEKWDCESILSKFICRQSKETNIIDTRSTFKRNLYIRLCPLVYMVEFMNLQLVFLCRYLFKFIQSSKTDWGTEESKAHQDEADWRGWGSCWNTCQTRSHEKTATAVGKGKLSCEEWVIRFYRPFFFI